MTPTVPPEPSTIAVETPEPRVGAPSQYPALTRMTRLACHPPIRERDRRDDAEGGVDELTSAVGDDEVGVGVLFADLQTEAFVAKELFEVVLGKSGSRWGDDVADPLDIADDIGDVAAAGILEIDHEETVLPPNGCLGVDGEDDIGEAGIAAVSGGVERAVGVGETLVETLDLEAHAVVGEHAPESPHVAEELISFAPRSGLWVVANLHIDSVWITVGFFIGMRCHVDRIGSGNGGGDHQ